MDAEIRLNHAYIEEALRLLCEKRGMGRLVSFRVVAAPEPDPPYAPREEPQIDIRVTLGQGGGE